MGVANTGKMIHVDFDVLEYLKKHSEPFESPNQVLRKLFKLPFRARGGPKRRPDGGRKGRDQ